MNISELDRNTLTDYIANSNNDLILDSHSDWLKPKYSNLFDFDIKFMKQGYNLHDYNDDEIVKYIKEHNHNDHIFHPKQLYNLFNDAIKILICKNDYIWIEYEHTLYKLEDFLKHIESYSYDTYKKLCIQEIENNNFTENKLLILLFIGSVDSIDVIIKYLIHYRNLETFSLAFCVNYKLITIALPIIQKYFTNYIIYSSNEFGNDITPSLLMYDEIINKYNFEYIIKVHTKSYKYLFNESLNFLFNSNLETLLLKKIEKCSSINSIYMKYDFDKHNELLYLKYKDLFKNSDYFVPGTIFLTKKSVIDNALQFLKDNYKTIFYQNMYDNNSINRHYSYVHFMERLFGCCENLFI
jgi:hypothetical protein